MKNIKFRVWNKGINSMYPVYGFNQRQIQWCKEDGSLGGSFSYGQNNKNKFILMQFTGLTDKNGKEIYEGDIIRLRTNFLKNAKKEEPEDYSEHIYTVTFFDGMFALSRGLPFNNGFVTDGIIEVIGNIYATPELLCN